MPKDKSGGTSVSRDLRHHPYRLQSRGSDTHRKENSSERRDWEDATCPICLECPHNAVLLLCSSHDKGCRPYMCNTSHRHSNCLDQYRKSQATLTKLENSREEIEQYSTQIVNNTATDESLDVSIVDDNSFIDVQRASRRPLFIHDHSLDTAPGSSSDVLSLNISSIDPVFASRRPRRFTAMSLAQNSVMHSLNEGADLEDATPGSQETHEQVTEPSPSKGVDVKNLLCPLCRGKVNGWKVVDAARKYLNGKSRNCSQETCSFSGTYEELRVHARCEHPLARPQEVDPVRQRNWRRLERQRDMGDVLSSIRSAMPGAVVFGDYVIEDEADIRSEAIDFLGDEGGWWRVLFLFQIFGPAATAARERSISSRLRGHHHRQRRAGTARLRQWVETLHRSGSEVDSNVLGSGSASDHTADTPPRRPRNPRRHWGDVN
ncbi:hypothetical protein KP509_04G079500 [Ceratopteris richardii]|nr:hypothetical protein KP509_04G079500 [Ceratopteris richardii]KAH7439866.1 hypothetical protein KP509_04G079500 [Ceratopteris richardii]KAH7439867.1 hypothetical protein KP509_04G079500 [Ceratopteris richardii]KAH7439868.1 hypothetical protein KP509_04G079500 [Ceratopteris richardii]